MAERDARERFARAVDEGATHSDDQEFGAELDLVTILRRAGAGRATDHRTRHSVAARIGSKITNATDTGTTPGEPAPTDPASSSAGPSDRTPARTQVRFRTTLVAAFCVLVSLGALLLVLSEAALPGEPLYPLKRARESVALTLTFDQHAEAMQQLAYAADRVDGLSELAENGLTPAETKGYRTGLDDFDAASRAASVLLTELAVTNGGHHLHTLRSWAASQARRLTALAQTLPPELARRQQSTIALLGRIQRRAQALRARFDCYEITSGASDELGVVPATGRCLPPGSDPAHTEPTVPAPLLAIPRQADLDVEHDEATPSTDNAPATNRENEHPGLRRVSTTDPGPRMWQGAPPFEHIEPAPVPPPTQRPRLPIGAHHATPPTLSGLVNEILPLPLG